MRHWLDATNDEVSAHLRGSGLPDYRAKQFIDWLHGKRVDGWEAMKNLPAALRDRLAGEGVLRSFRELERRDAQDGLTHKWLWETQGREGSPRDLLECVLIIEKRENRRTACLSCMAGCPLGCVFCATGRLGFSRALTAGEILEQAYRMDAWLREDGRAGLSHVVFMGMGEPLLNLPAVLAAARRLHDPAALGLSGRHITISTVGIPEGIRALSASGVTHRLAVSLHAPTQRQREAIIPAAKRWPLTELLPALQEYAAGASRDITFEYCLIQGVNAGLADARELLRLLRPFRCLVNLIPYNPVPGADLRPPSAKAVRAFQEELEKAGVAVTVRMEKGAEIGAACGQLKAERMGK